MNAMDRRRALALLAVASSSSACETRREPASTVTPSSASNLRGVASAVPRTGLNEARVSQTFALETGAPWPTLDPFLFCVHHSDRYPVGNGKYGPQATLEGRALGEDFGRKDGWSMYHGLSVPGFPRHPHRGFETVTVVRRGRLDHADSMGAIARYGDGDVQWLTAGAGIQHAEMFPLLSSTKPNPLDLFQIWLNLPRAEKFAPPHFSMLWAPTIPVQTIEDDAGREVRCTIRAGQLGATRAPSPPPHSWAARPENDVGIFTIELAPQASWLLPAALPGVQRMVYCIAGGLAALGQTPLDAGHGARLDSHLAVRMTAGNAPAELLVLQGRPIGEPVARRGPFVMTTTEELRQAVRDFQATEFGGWPWPDSAPVHGSSPERFARRADGTTDRPA